MLHTWLSVHVSPQSYPHPFVTSTLTIFKVASCLILLSVIVPLPFGSYICWENKAMRKERPRHTHTLKSPSVNSPSMFLFWLVPSLDHLSKAQDSLLLDTVSKAPPGGVHQPLLLLGEPPIPSFLWISPTLPSWFLHLHPDDWLRWGWCSLALEVSTRWPLELFYGCTMARDWWCGLKTSLNHSFLGSKSEHITVSGGSRFKHMRQGHFSVDRFNLLSCLSKEVI